MDFTLNGKSVSVPAEQGGSGGRVGSRAPRYAGREPALGDKPFINDMSVPGVLHGAIRFADRPRAKILSVQTARARAYPGVVAVLTAGDVPGDRIQGELTKDWIQICAPGETNAGLRSMSTSPAVRPARSCIRWGMM
ncbi:MAG TPA: hypothetical protein VEF71_04125 [Streptosporangiaceae bacterium]|nr:hypothetical protein [Streptosporangiaceae bacterium]